VVSYLQIDNLSKRFGDLALYENVSFGVAQGQKIGLVARNGAGKSTLFNMICGREPADGGAIVFRKNLRTGYLEQSPAFPEGWTVLQACFSSQNETVRLIADYEAALSADDARALETLIPRMEHAKAWDYERKAKQILSQLKITDFDQKTETLSGGQLKRVALANVLILDPELILLDEPTNHLDPDMIEWLEGYLKRSAVSLLMITHDRYFLDEVCNEIMEIDNRRLYFYKGNYSYYLDKRADRVEAMQAAVEQANSLMRKELEWMRRQPQARGTKAKYRIDAFHELEKKAGQREDDRDVKLNVKASYIGSKIFEAVRVCKNFGDRKILHQFSYTFSRYEKLGITGPNGAGKSTFIKLLTGELQPDSGRFDVGETVRFGYYSQEGLSFDGKMKVIDVVQNIAEYIDVGNGKSLSVSQFLNYFLFAPEKQHSYVHKLSGGEKRRLYLCTVLMRNPNFLVLDEPTNDLDIVTLNVLEDYLANFRGCVIVVSHDRYFMDRVVDHLLVFHGNADIRDFPGNYTQYRLWKSSSANPPDSCPAASVAPDKAAYRQPSDKKRLTYKEQKEVEALEIAIPALEKEKSALEESLNSGALSIDELNRHASRIGELITLIDEKTMRWLSLND
jgi:ATP-binding cassette subfamily F protein uup